MKQRIKRLLRRGFNTLVKPDAPLAPPLIEKHLLDITEFEFSPGEKVTLNKKPNLVYLVAPLQRSGHNYISNLLLKHEQLQFPSGTNLPGEQNIMQHAGHLMEYASKTVAGQKGWEHKTQEQVKLQSAILLRVLGHSLIEYYAKFIPANSTYILLKDPATIGIENFSSVFPEAKLICLLRDGRDVVQSLIKTFKNFDFEQGCKLWSEGTNRMLNLPEEDLGKRFLLIRYENVFSNPTAEMKAVLAFLNLNESEYAFDKIDEMPIFGSSTNSVNERGEVDWSITNNRKDFKPVGKWQQWSAAQKNIFKKIAGETLIRAGYEQHNNW